MRKGKEVIEELRNLMWQVQTVAGKEFSGLGLLICDTPDVLPISPLRPLSIPSSEWDLIDLLVNISAPDNEYHDGFHIISSDWRLKRMSQYFSPPISDIAMFDRKKVFGARYSAAIFGSAIPSVELAGIASRRSGIAIFKDGKERYSETTS